MHDNHCDGRTPNARFWEKVDSMAGEGPSFSKSANIPEVDVSTPIGPEIVSKPAKPTLPEPLEVFSVDYQLFVLVSEVYRNTDLFGQGEGGDESPISGLNLLAEEEQGGKASPTNSEDYKTPPEDDPMTECRTPDVGNSKLSRYLTRSLKKAELEGKCIPISSTKKDDLQTKRIPRRSTKIGGVYTPDKRLKKLFQSCKKPKYTPLADLEKAQFQEFQSILREKPAQRHGRNYLSRRCRFVDYFSIAGIISKFAEFEKASDKLGFNWGGLVSFSFTGKTPRRNDKKVLLVDVDRLYAPMMWGKDHWVGLVINLTCRQVKILDCNIPLNESDNEVNKHMAYLLRTLPHVLAAFSPPSDSSHPEEDQAFSWVRPDNIYFNERSGDCGPCTVKFLEMHAAGYSYEDMGQIDDKKEASKLFQQFEANHYDLRSDAIVGLGADLEWRLISFGAPYMNRYGASFKFPDDEVIKSPSCLYGHDYTVDFEGSCKNCRLFWICCNISHIL
ncbi:BnaCnng53970D [Brassica napus]|uniref:BnaCnng53970D protein n=1 Tax=Brassica napus TaxID=3708 RepID=A0A078JN94_BRANA|nr:BnaCnng53970D [Brassica napus]